MREQNNLQNPQHQTNNLTGNVWKFYLYRGTFGFGKGLLIPIIILFFLDRGITLATFTLFWALLNAVTVVFEIPTGIIADRFSRKWSVCTGALFDVTAIIILLSTTKISLLPLGFMAWGLSQALQSGAASALLYDSLKADDREDEFQKRIGAATSINLVAMVGGAALSGVLVSTGGFVWPWLIALGVQGVGCLATLMLKEPPFLVEVRGKEQASSFKGHWSGYVDHLKISWQIFRQQRGLLALSFLSLVSARMFILVERPFAQPFLASFDYAPAQISYFHSLFFIITALFAKNSHKISKVEGNSERYVIMGVGLFGLLSLLMMVNAWLGPILVTGLIGIYLTKGLLTPLIETSLNRRLNSEQRASCLSMTSMGNNLLGIFLGPLFGYLAGAFSLSTSLLIFQWIFAPLLIGGVIWVWVVLGRTPVPSAVS